MNETILVTGGTGVIGRRVVPLLGAAGREVRVLSRRGGTDAPGVHHVVGDTLRGEGLDAAFGGASTVLHLAGAAKGDDVAARHVIEAAERAGTGHLVLISVTGAGAVPIGYVRMKAASERIVHESAVPYTIIRVAQLHSLLLPVVAKLAVMRLAPADVRLEPIDGDAVAARLAELTLNPPAGRVADLAGPEILSFADLVKQYNATLGRHRRVLGMPLPGALRRAYRSGANLAGDPVDRRGGTWRDFLAGSEVCTNRHASDPESVLDRPSGRGQVEGNLGG
ncbi:SDR family oxidoreductase [Micromonospora sp. DT81.3]|uniref:SDR family oxidoreductase n=1 Tax=Micromonospora sp. DT81.3 TaxID=3416523 RepID=UPI003CEAEF89